MNMRGYNHAYFSCNDDDERDHVINDDTCDSELNLYLLSNNFMHRNIL